MISNALKHILNLLFQNSFLKENQQYLLLLLLLFKRFTFNFRRLSYTLSVFSILTNK